MQSQVPRFSSGFHGYITLKNKKVLLAGLPWLQLLADLVQEEVGFLDTLSFLLLAALSKVQVGLVAADAAVRRPSVGLSAVAASSRPDGGDCGRTVCCGAGSAAAAAPRRPRLHRKKLRQHRPGKGWGAVAAPFNSLLLHTPRDPAS